MTALFLTHRRSSFERNFSITYHLLPNKNDSLKKVVAKVTFNVFTGLLVPFFSLMYEVSRNLYLYKSINAPKTGIEKVREFIKDNETIFDIFLTIVIGNICPRPISFVITKITPKSLLQNDLLKVVDFVNWPSSQLSRFGGWLGSFRWYISNTIFLVPRIALSLAHNECNVEVVAFRSLLQRIMKIIT